MHLSINGEDVSQGNSLRLNCDTLRNNPEDRDEEDKGERTRRIERAVADIVAQGEKYERSYSFDPDEISLRKNITYIKNLYQYCEKYVFVLFML